MSKEALKLIDETARLEADEETAEWARRLSNVTGSEEGDIIPPPQGAFLSRCRICGRMPDLVKKSYIEEGEKQISEIYLYACGACGNCETVKLTEEFPARRAWNMANGGTQERLFELVETLERLLGVFDKSTLVNPGPYTNEPKTLLDALFEIQLEIRDVKLGLQNANTGELVTYTREVKEAIDALRCAMEQMLQSTIKVQNYS